MRILYINHYAGSPRHGMEYRPHYLARHWVRMGHDVVVVAASVSHLRRNPPSMSSGATEETIDGVRFLWLKTPEYHNNGVRRAINMAAFVTGLYRIKRSLLQRFSPDAVIASSTYTWDIFPARSIAQATGAKLVYEVHDLWPLSPIELGGMSKWHPFIMSLQWGEEYACRHADVVVSLLPLADKHLCKHGLAPEKFHYVPNGIELPEWNVETDYLPQPYVEFFTKLHQEGRFIICYAGSHGLSDALDRILEVAKLVEEQPVDFVLVGHGPDKARLQGKAVRMGLRNLHFLDAVSKQAVPALLRQMDALFIGWKRQPLYRFGISPNKLMDYMASGKPIISASSAGNDSVGEAGCGFSVDAEDSGAIAEAVIKLINLPAEQRQQLGMAGKNYVQRNYDYAVLAKKFLNHMFS